MSLRSMLGSVVGSMFETASMAVVDQTAMLRAVPVLASTFLAQRAGRLPGWDAYVTSTPTGPLLVFQHKDGSRYSVDLEGRRILEEPPPELAELLHGFRYQPVTAEDLDWDPEREAASAEMERMREWGTALERGKARPQSLRSPNLDEKIQRAYARTKANEALRNAGLGHLAWDKTRRG